MSWEARASGAPESGDDVFVHFSAILQAWRQMAARQAAEPGGHDAQQPDAPSGPPTGVAVFAADTTIRALLDPGAAMHLSEFDRGGHFPAMEAPDLLVGDLRAFFRPLHTKEGP